MDIPKLEGIEDLFKGKGWHLLLAMMLGLFFLSPAFQGNGIGAFALMETLFWIVFIVMALRCKNHWTVRCLIFGLAFSALLSGLVGDIFLASFGLTLLHRSLSLCATTLVFCVLLKHLYLADRATWGTISCSLCAYLTMATAWTNAFMLALSLKPGTIAYVAGMNIVPLHVDNMASMGEIFYFSLSTLTSVGYGDIIPTNNWTRMMCGAETVMGQFYMAVVLARIVALHISDRSREAKS